MIWRMIATSILVVLAWIGATPAWSADAQPPAPPWDSPLAHEAPHIGEIRDIRAGRSLTPDALIERLAAVDFVLLGERHDNPDHHRLQAWIADRLFTRGRPYAVAFEMIDSSQSERLADHLAKSPRDAAGLGPALNWEKNGWPDWQLYQPIAEAALSRNLPILSANLPPSLVRAIAMDGLKALPAPLAQSLQLAPDKDTEILAAHAAEIQDAHCGMLPARSLAPFALAQYARDAEMARAMADPWRQNNGKTGVVLIAGAGHVRTDRGVPFQLARIAPAARVLSLAFVEARDGDTMGPDFFSSLPYDFVWLTARVDDGTNACDKLKPAR